MAKFLDPLKVKLLSETANDGRGKWVFLRRYRFQSDCAGETFCIPVGFETDFESCPRIPFIYELLGGISRQSSGVHDFLYVTKPVSRSMADAVLREASIASGLSAWKSWGLWAGVRIGGWIAYYDVFKWHVPDS